MTLNQVLDEIILLAKAQGAVNKETKASVEILNQRLEFIEQRVHGLEIRLGKVLHEFDITSKKEKTP